MVRSACLSVYFLLMARLFMGCTLGPNAIGFDYSISLLSWGNCLYFVKISNCK